MLDIYSRACAAYARCGIYTPDCLLGPGVHNTERYWVEMGPHTVHAEANHTKIFKPPIKCVEVPLFKFLKTAILRTRQIDEKMRRREAHQT